MAATETLPSDQDDITALLFDGVLAAEPEDQAGMLAVKPADQAAPAEQPAARGNIRPGAPPKPVGTIRASVEACGYELVSIDNRHDGKRLRRYLRVRCPEGHEYDVMWDNFSPKDGVPRRGCRTCASKESGNAKRNCIDQWVSKHGIVPVTPYTSNSAICKWRCSAGHTFTARMSALKLKKENPCTECWLGEFARAHGLYLQTRWTDGCGPTTSLEWHCLECGNVFTAPITSLGRKKLLCANCG